MHRSILPMIAALAAPYPLLAQENASEIAWVQIEAHPSLSEARENAELFDETQDNVVGFTLGRDWFGIALGPYSPDDAQKLLRQLRRAGDIPSDSFIVDGRRFGTQFYPIGTGAAQSPLPLPGSDAQATRDGALEEASSEAPIAEAAADQAAETQSPSTQTGESATPEPAAQPVALDETPREARASESELSLEEKKDLQRAMKWAGAYSGAIDGLYGRGTRNAMAAWQASQQFEETGVLTTAQRASLLAQYNAILNGMDLQAYRDDEAGIEIQIPTGAVNFTAHDAPFARFEASGSVPEATVLLISQEGDRDTLAGLYAVMETLQIVPTQGERRLRRDRFTLEGTSERIVSYTEASLERGQIKGFTLVWPAGDEERRTRILEKMRASFKRTDGVLDATMIAGESSSADTDLVSGLAIRKPLRIRSGIFVTDRGAIASEAGVAHNCGSLQLDGDIDLRVTYEDEALTLLEPTSPVSPMAVGKLSLDGSAAQDRIALAGFPFGGVMPLATMTFGDVQALGGLRGEEELARVSLRTEPSERGGPIVNTAGEVVGMLTNPEADKVLPRGVGFALSSSYIIEKMKAADLRPSLAEGGENKSNEALTLETPRMTALITCWE